MKTSTDTASLDYNPILIDITTKVIMTPTEAIPGHTTGITDDITGVVNNAYTQTLTHIILAVTLHITDHLHIETLQLTPEQIMLLTSLQTHQGKPHTTLHHIPADNMVKHIQKGSQRLQ